MPIERIPPRLGLVAVIILIPAVTLWFVLGIVLPISGAFTGADQTFGQHIESEGESYREGIASVLEEMVARPSYVYYSSPMGFWLTFIIAVLLVFWWKKLAETGAIAGKDRLFLASTAALPILAGVAWFVVEFRDGAKILALQGLARSDYFGLMIGETLASVIDGLILCVLLLLGLPWICRQQKGKAATEKPNPNEEP